jgi:hypothetical protein
MNINLSDEQMRGMVAAAIFEKIDDDKKKQLITEAIAHILLPEKARYGESLPSPLAQAMQFALRDIAREEVVAYIEKDGTREKLRGIVSDAFDTVFAKGELREKLCSAIADSFTECIRVKSSY